MREYKIVEQESQVDIIHQVIFSCYFVDDEDNDKSYYAYSSSMYQLKVGEELLGDLENEKKNPS